MNKEVKEKKKLNLKERLKDKREKAKLELIIYGVFFLIIILFTRFSSNIELPQDETTTTVNSFINSIEDNYEYNITITLNNDKYEYYGKVLGNNSTINLVDKEEVKTYRKMNKKYYILEDENYILTTEEEIYPNIDSRYLNAKTIQNYLTVAEKKDNHYEIKISDILLNNNSNEIITIYIEEGDKNIVIDYTNLFKITKDEIDNAIVNITYNNINSIISLD